MAIIKHYVKSSGITYIYESISYWDKEKKQSRSKRTLLGKLDPETGEMIPTRKRAKKEELETAARAKAALEEALLKNAKLELELKLQQARLKELECENEKLVSELSNLSKKSEECNCLASSRKSK